MPNGFNGKTLRVDLSGRKIWTEARLAELDLTWANRQLERLEAAI